MTIAEVVKTTGEIPRKATTVNGEQIILQYTIEGKWWWANLCLVKGDSEFDVILRGRGITKQKAYNLLKTRIIQNL